MSSDGPEFPIAAPLASSLLRGQCNPFLVTSFIQHCGGPHPIFYPAVEVVNPDQRLHGLQLVRALVLGVLKLIEYLY